MFSIKKNILILYLIFIILINFYPDSVKKIDDLSFLNTEITEILKAVSEVFGITIVPDKDIQGTITRYFKDTSLEQTLTLLLEPLDFTYEVKDGIYFVKKKPAFSVNYDNAKKIFNIKAGKAKLQDIINDMSIKSNQTIIFDGSSNDIVTINIFNKDILESLTLLTDTLKYDIKNDAKSYYVKKKEEDIFFAEAGKSTGISIKGEEDKIQLKVYNQSSNDILLALFRKFNKKLSLLSTKTIKIPYLDIENISFDQLLNVIFQHSTQSYTKQNDVYYIYDSLATKESSPYRISAVYKLKNLDSKSFQMNVPAQIIPQTSYKLDPDSNEVIIVGSPEEVDQYLNFIKNIDSDKNNMNIRIFKLRNIDIKKIKTYLPDKYQRLKLTVIDDQNIFTASLDDVDYQNLKNYIEKLDVTIKKDYRYKFKYLDPEDVLKSMIPKTFKPEQFMLNKSDSALICSVNEDDKESLFSYFDTIDTPNPVIRYQILIVNYQDTNNFNLNYGIGLNAQQNQNNLLDLFNSDIGGGIFQNGNSLSFGIDIPTIFGNYFSASLNVLLSENKAKIKLSSEVYGLSGEKVNLTSTVTNQTTGFIVDDQTKISKPVYTATTTGLNIEIKGRATSSDEVYLEVSAKNSDATPNAADSSGGTPPPNTSEKSVKNTIRTKTGKAIALGGLTNNKETIANTKIPGLGDIPFIGNLFKTHNDQFDNNEFIIYIIPFIQKSEEDLYKERREYVKKIYDYFLGT